MAQFDDSLKAALYRITCPDSAALGHYHLGLLPDAAATPIAEHLAICPHCTQEIAQLEAFLVETAVSHQPSISERIKVWIAKRLPTGGQPQAGWSSPTFAVRGGDTGPLMYEAGDAQLSLEVQDDPEHPGRKSILGLVLGIDTANVAARLLQADKEGTAVPLSPGGNFAFTNLAVGPYQLIITGPDIEIHLPELTIA
ncbi:MAG: hypothetical protein IPJ90_22215 [Anaerolineaceae bacterium]|nr:hypothetical protein [Anaerolineaceae bacterium]